MSRSHVAVEIQVRFYCDLCKALLYSRRTHGSRENKIKHFSKSSTLKVAFRVLRIASCSSVSSPPARGVGEPLARLEHGPRIARLEQPAGAGAQPLGRAHAQLLLEGGDGAAPGCGCGADYLGVTGGAL